MDPKFHNCLPSCYPAWRPCATSRGASGLHPARSRRSRRVACSSAPPPPTSPPLSCLPINSQIEPSIFTGASRGLEEDSLVGRNAAAQPTTDSSAECRISQKCCPHPNRRKAIRAITDRYRYPGGNSFRPVLNYGIVHFVGKQHSLSE